ncbi:MAG: type 2 lanthipeptide synthetase LanM family protein [Candidatus Dormibacteraceae bacterium]
MREEIPFRPVLESLSAPWRLRLDAHLGRTLGGSAEDLVAPAALDDAVEGLVGRLAFLCARPLYAHFSASRFLSGIPARGASPSSTAFYEQFVSEHTGPGWHRFVSEYPELERLIMVTGRQWLAAAGEVLAHLRSDLHRLARTPGPPTELGPLVGLRLGLSDLHRGGRSAVQLRFASGRRWIYKPKSVGAELVLARIVGEVSARSRQPATRLPAVIDAGSHGWVEHLEHEPVEDRAAAARFWRRAGVLLAVAHALGTTDLHFENILAAGEHPMVLDAETALSAVFASQSGGSELSSAAFQDLRASVAITGLLPLWLGVRRRARGGDAPEGVQLGGLGDAGRSRLLVDRWEHVNTDAMTLGQRIVPWAPSPNLPELHGRPVLGAACVDQVVAAFRAAYRDLLATREAFSRPGGEVDELARHPVRVVYRPTASYARALLASKDLACLRDPSRRRRTLLERLVPIPGESSPGPASDPGHRVIAAAELEAMLDLDVPAFSVMADDVCVLGADGPKLAESARARALRRLAGLSSRDGERQVELIRAAFSGAWPSRQVGRSAPPAGDGRAESASPAAAGAERLARLVADSSSERRRGGDDPESWLGAVYDHLLGEVGIAPLGPDLYGGTAGMAMVLAELARSAGPGPEDWGRLARACAEPLLLWAEAPGDHLPWAGPGLAAGLGGVLLSLARTAEALGDDAYLHAARAIIDSGHVETEIDGGRSYDLLEGAAGLVLGLLALNARQAGDRTLTLAERAGRHLLAGRTPASSGHRAWPSYGGAILCGAGHGASGIALALSRLVAATAEPAFGEAAIEALAFERACFDPSTGRWPDRRPWIAPSAADRTALGWCHGLSGAALCRAGVLQALQGGTVQAAEPRLAEIRDDLEQAVASIPARGLPPSDTLCCGEAGRIQALLVAGRVLGRPDLLASGSRAAGALAGRALGGGELRLVARGVSARLAPSLMQGALGVAQTLLAAAHPEAVTPLLEWG